MMSEVIYAPSARFDEKGHALTDDDLMMLAPSVFATHAHDSRSDKFAPIATIEILRALAKEGFEAVGAKQARSRTPDRHDFTKHLIRLRRMDGVQRKVGDTVFELLLKNANDGSSAYKLMGGLWRIRCLNSLVVQTDTLADATVRHTATAAAQVIEASYKVLGESERSLNFADQWGRIGLDEIERLSFARSAHKLRFGNHEAGAGSAIKPGQLLEARRDGDRGTDLWTTFNVIQENVIRGGQEGVGRNSRKQEKRFRSRPIAGIDADVALNRAIFGLAEAMAVQKGVPALV